MRTMDLSGKTILVTGGSRGIGAATVRLVVQLGAKVILHYGQSLLAAEDISRELGEENCHLISADLSNSGAATSLWDKACTWTGRIDVLVNNAGIYEPAPNDLSLEAWQQAWARMLQINLVAPAELCRTAAQHFSSHGEGIIVNVSSRSAFRGELPEYAHYAASKGGLVSLTRTIARSYAHAGVIAYCVAPGWTDTDMASKDVDSEILAKVKSEIPLGDIVPPEEVASVIAFLATGCARHATGATIDVNGASYTR